MENPNGALRKNDDWPNGGKTARFARRSLPFSVWVARLLGVVQEANRPVGVLVSAPPRGPRSAPKERFAIMGKCQMAQEAGVEEYFAPSLPKGGETLYGAIWKRIVEVHRSGIFNATRNLLSHLTQGQEGPMLPPVCGWAFRMTLAKIGSAYAKTGRFIVAGRPKPYESRWRYAYFARLVSRSRGERRAQVLVWKERSSTTCYAGVCAARAHRAGEIFRLVF